jgi:hypothetical protein
MRRGRMSVAVNAKRAQAVIMERQLSFDAARTVATAAL